VGVEEPPLLGQRPRRRRVGARREDETGEGAGKGESRREARGTRAHRYLQPCAGRSGRRSSSEAKRGGTVHAGTLTLTAFFHGVAGGFRLGRARARARAALGGF